MSRSGRVAASSSGGVGSCLWPAGETGEETASSGGRGGAGGRRGGSAAAGRKHGVDLIEVVDFGGCVGFVCMGGLSVVVGLIKSKIDNGGEGNGGVEGVYLNF